MAVYERDCGFCEGSGSAERWTRATFAGGQVARPWECDEGVQRMIAEDPEGIEVEWEEVECPRCGGTGREMVETMPPGVAIF